MTGRGATPETILSLFASRGNEFSEFSARRNSSTAAHRVAKFGGRNRDTQKRDRRVMALAADVFRRCIREVDPQHVAKTVRALATAGIEAPRQLFAAIAGAAPALLDEFKPQELANTAWAFATAGIEAPHQLFAAIAGAAPSLLDEFNPQGLANTVWAFATAGIEAPHQLFAAIAGAACSLLDTFNPQDLANTAWALATAGIEAPRQLFAAIAGVASSRLSEFKPQDVANTAWAFLHLASLHFHLEWPEYRSSPLSKDPQMLLGAYQRQDPSPSQLERDVATALDRVGWTRVFEYVTEGGLSVPRHGST
ncbi:hypothetical protein CTAYLR_004480 [Chrysophaeum taylorii]|uniref:RNA-editing substrate-binding complex 6 protein domain-containing protein n=1 Tax=Chrysophaeum taylorii TaxID=2483200 RepID=A0AAD7XID0_9STRA|nr:hypothetical protein CTAYLR_004428 [Chrysophaeum taylorii]KAJ8613630.1 hypothetical protein CTAYLR_004480 [Chrysophaeum taylorii]